jgi:hypothetical protein
VQRGHAPAVVRAAEGPAPVDVGAELDEPLDRFDAVALRRPDERLVEDLLRVVRRLPGRKAAVRAIEAAVRTGRGRAGELVDQVDAAEPGRDA